jgi:hypothetical protein
VDSSVGIAKGYELDGQGSIPGKDKRFLPLHNVQTGSGAYPASYAMGTGDLFPGVKLPGREAIHSPPASAEVKNDRVMFPFPNTSSWRCNRLIKHGDKFTFTQLMCQTLIV